MTLGEMFDKLEILSELESKKLELLLKMKTAAESESYYLRMDIDALDIQISVLRSKELTE